MQGGHTAKGILQLHCVEHQLQGGELVGHPDLQFFLRNRQSNDGFEFVDEKGRELRKGLALLADQLVVVWTVAARYFYELRILQEG